MATTEELEIIRLLDVDSSDAAIAMPPDEVREPPPAPPQSSSYARNARILSIGIAATGLFTFVYFSLASHVLGEVQAKRVDLVWSVMFVIISVIYRPIEQLLSRTIAERRARGLAGHPLRVPLTIQASCALLFLAIVLPLHRQIVDGVFAGSTILYWVLVSGVLFYAGSYFARGWLAGHQLFGLYGGLVLMEAVSRVVFALVVAFGLISAHKQSAVAVGIAAAPFLSLLVVPFALRALRDEPDGHAQADAPSARHSTHFAISVAGIMLAEQALLNGPVLTVDATAANAALAGIVFNVLLIARAPLQLFQSIQTSLLPHLAGLEATQGHAAFAKAIRTTVLAIAAFAGLVALGLLVVGPFVMSHLFGQHFEYNRFGLAFVGIGMGLHLCAGTLNQAALARGQAARSGAAWLVCAAFFLIWTALPLMPDQLMRVEIGYALATGLLCGLLYVVYRAGDAERTGARPAVVSARG